MEQKLEKLEALATSAAKSKSVAQAAYQTAFYRAEDARQSCEEAEAEMKAAWSTYEAAAKAVEDAKKAMFLARVDVMAEFKEKKV